MDISHRHLRRSADLKKTFDATLLQSAFSLIINAHLSLSLVTRYSYRFVPAKHSFFFRNTSTYDCDYTDSISLPVANRRAVGFQASPFAPPDAQTRILSGSENQLTVRNRRTTVKKFHPYLIFIILCREELSRPSLSPIREETLLSRDRRRLSHLERKTRLGGIRYIFFF